MAKFKVGEKVRVKKDAKSIPGLIFMSEMKRFLGQKVTIRSVLENDEYYIEEDTTCDHGWFWHESWLEPVEFTKADLEGGMVVELRNGERLLVTREYWVGNYRCFDRIIFSDDLTHKNDEKLDVIKVFRVRDPRCLVEVFDDRTLGLIWERKEEPDFTEMTVAEIEEKLGYKIKVVGDKE